MEGINNFEVAILHSQWRQFNVTDDASLNHLSRIYLNQAVAAFLLIALGLVPSRNPFFNLLYTSLVYACLPVPGAFLRMAFLAQLYRLSFLPPPTPDSRPFCLCQLDLPVILLSV